MTNSELLKTLIQHDLISEESVKDWTDKLFFSPHAEGACPWDPWLDKLWREKDRSTFESMTDFYDHDCCVVFQGTMSGSWNNCTLSDRIKDYIKPNMKVLDYGSGGGREAFSCLKAGCSVTICDVSARLLAGVKLLSNQNGHEIETILIEQEVPVLPTGFDFVITFDCLEHVKKPVDVLSTLINSLNPGGYLCIEVFFGGHEMSPYHLSENFYLGNLEVWHSLLRSFNMTKIDIDGYLWQKGK